ncbi:MAG: hypothetical protein ACI9DC_005672, partial [Gammaproteobacteria bacterium]
SPAHRYGIFLVVSCVALFVLVLPVFERWMANARTMRVVLGLTALLASAYLVQQVMVGEFAAQRADRFAEFEKKILAGYGKGKGNRDAVQAIYIPGADALERHYRVLEKHRIHMFRP